jgi:type IV pilus assembly protein PilN
MRIRLNLATRPFTDLGPAIRRLRIAMGVLAVLSILFGLGLHFLDRRAAEARAREHAVDAQIARVQAERQRADNFMHLPANAQLLDRSKALNQIFDDKAFSWTLAMEALETVLPAGVQVTAIEPIRDKEGHITVHLRVVGGHDHAVELVRNIERSRRFLLPRIVNESAETSNTPNRPQGPATASDRFDFDLLADYNPPVLEDRAAVRTAPKSTAQTASPGAHPGHSRTAPAFVRNPERQPYTGPAPSQPGAAPQYFHNPTRPPGGAQ